LSLIGAVGLVAAIIFFALRWSLAPQVAMVEGAGALRSLGRSWRLIDGSTWRLLGYYLLLGLTLAGFFLLTALVVGLFETLVFGPGFRIEGGQVVIVPPPSIAIVVSSVLSALALALVTPWWVTLLTLFYFDLRWRRGEPLTSNAAATPAAV
jgi:hypothetical protein